MPASVRRSADSLPPGTRAQGGADERLTMFRHGLQHHLNALHVMARLVRLGLPRPRAHALAGWWERVVHPLLYSARRPLLPVHVISLAPLTVRPRRRDV